ncbi:hypothetical protein Vadar_016072 [Vaccinium darrowii]|uniref:Uncharacterized protein n=1 Tax=Vaccinium darrowii TaxID=229202 RepID=A0ACB7Y7L7_9ERIC|nr:hypothetical protein Vadar_016072 [Vaccinium darrowii]
MKEADQVFKITFALYILGAFLCPTTRDDINQSFVHVVIDVETMEKMNWAKLTLDFYARVYGRSAEMVVYKEIGGYSSLWYAISEQTKEILRRFCNINSYDMEGVVVHFLTEEGRVKEKSDGHERGESKRGVGDIAGLKICTLATLVGLTLWNNVLLAKYLGSPMLRQPQPKPDEEVGPNKHASTYPTPNQVRLAQMKDPNEG